MRISILVIKVCNAILTNKELSSNITNAFKLSTYYIKFKIYILTDYAYLNKANQLPDYIRGIIWSRLLPIYDFKSRFVVLMWLVWIG